MKGSFFSLPLDAEEAIVPDGAPPPGGRTLCATTSGPDTTTSFSFDAGRLQELAERHAKGYARAQPFPHVVFDGFLPDWVADVLLTEFPAPRGESWTVYDDAAQKKLEGTDQSEMGPFTRHVFHELNSSTFVEFLETLTGIDGLIPDPHLHGGGLHQIEPGGFLKVHADFNWNRKLRLDRRLNLLLYLNRDWREEYGGHLELWDRDMRRCERRILPVFNRCVVFSTTSWSHHGHPDPLSCPPERTRKSMALYYYTNGRPADEVDDVHGTEFAPRPGEVWRREVTSPRLAVKQVVPPVLWQWGKSIKDNRERRRRSRRG